MRREGGEGEEVKRVECCKKYRDGKENTMENLG